MNTWLQWGKSDDTPHFMVKPKRNSSLFQAPVITALAAVSDASRVRCLQSLDAQRVLIEARITRALQRKLGVERDTPRQLRTFLRVYEGLRSALAAPSHPSARPVSLEPAQIHAYLGLA